MKTIADWRQKGTVEIQMVSSNDQRSTMIFTREMWLNLGKQLGQHFMSSAENLNLSAKTSLLLNQNKGQITAIADSKNEFPLALAGESEFMICTDEDDNDQITDESNCSESDESWADPIPSTVLDSKLWALYHK